MGRSLVTSLLFVLLGTIVAQAETIKTITLGAVYNLSGDQASLDVPSLNGAKLAVNQANESGRVNGHPVELVIVDGQSSLDLVRERTETLLNEQPGISALFGLSDTDMVMAAAPVAAEHEHLFLTSGATSPKLPSDVPTYLFLACFGDNVQAAAGAEWAYTELGARSVWVIYDTTHTYTTLLQGYFRERFEALGGEVVAVTPFGTGNDLSSAIVDAKSADLIYLATEAATDAFNGVATLRAAGIETTILGGDGYDSEKAWAKDPTIGDVYFTTHAYLGADNTNPEVQAFRKAYQDAYDREPDSFAALGYDAANLLMTAVLNAQSDEPSAMVEGLSAVSDFRGVTGTFSYNGGSRIPKKSVSVLKVEEGKQTFVAEFVPKVIPAP